MFAVREFRALWAAQLTSVIGDQLARVALTVLVYDRTNSALLAAVTFMVSVVPVFIGGITLAGLADRFPRRRVMIVCDLLRTALVLVMALAGIPLAALVVLLAVVTLVGAPFTAARSAIYPDLLPGEKYVTGTAVTLTTNQFAQVLGFAVGGAVVAGLGTRPSLVLDAATFAVSAAVVRAFVRWRPAPAQALSLQAPSSQAPPSQAPSSQAPSSQGAPSSQLAPSSQAPSSAPAASAASPSAALSPAAASASSLGTSPAPVPAPPSASSAPLSAVSLARASHGAVRMVFTTRAMLLPMLFGWLAAFYNAPEGVAAPLARGLGGGAPEVGAILAAQALGETVGMLAFGRLAKPASRQRLMGPLAVATCTVLVLFAVHPSLPATLAILAVSGAFGAYQIAANAAFVSAVPGERRARAFGLAQGGMSLGQGTVMVAAGAAAQSFTPATVIAVSGAVGAVCAVCVAVNWARSRKADAPGG